LGERLFMVCTLLIVSVSIDKKGYSKSL
jgi:hypothetical protein